jgi:glycine cleavage system H protein
MYPKEYRYTKEHEWVDPTSTPWKVGITDFAQKQLGDVVFVEAPMVGKTVEVGDEIGTIESVKAVSQLFSPVSGKVVASNAELGDEPELINTDPHGEAWIVTIEPSNKKELDALMTADAYEKFLASEEH